jgi:hypothetical protein
LAALRRTLTLLVSSALLAAGGLGWYFYLHYSDPETVRALALQWARSACSKGSIEIDSAEASLLGGVHLRNVRLTLDDGLAGEDVLSLEGVSIHPDRGKLLEGALAVRRVVLERPRVHLHQGPDGSWNLSRLLSDKLICFSHRTEVVVRDAAVHVTFDDPKKPDVVLEGLSGDVQLAPAGEATWRLHGRHALVHAFAATGRADLVENRIRMEFHSKAPLDLSRLYVEIPREIRERLGELRELSGLVHLSATASAEKAGDAWAWEGSVEGRVEQGFALHDRLPYPIQDAHGAFTATPDGFVVSLSEFVFGSARGALKAHLPSWDAERAEAKGTLRNFEVTPAVRRVLDDKGKELWDKFHPAGFVDLEGRIVVSGERATLAGSAEVRDGSFRFEGFAYPVDDLAGRGTLSEDGRLQFSLEGRAKSSKVTIDGEMAGLAAPAPAEIAIRADRVRLDEDLLRALPAASAKVVQDMHPGATEGDVRCRIVREAGAAKYYHVSEVDVRSTEAAWTGFPYRVENVRGRLRISPQRVVFEDFSAEAQGARIRLRGQSYAQTNGVHVEVGITAKDLPLDERLTSAMPEKWRAPWRKLRATGRADLTCSIVRAPGEEMSIEMDVDPAAASIEPEQFPYRIHSFQGKIGCRDNVIAWSPTSFQHGDVALACSGSLTLREDGGVLEIRELVSNNLRYDDDFRRAAPPSLRRTLDYLRPTRPVGIRFPHVRLEWAEAPRRDWRIEIEGGVAMQDANLLEGETIRGATGVLWYRGECVNDSPKFVGNVDFAAIDVHGFRATKVRSSFRIDGERFEMPNIRGDMYAGQLHGSIRATTGAQAAQECRFNLYGGRLREYARTHFTDASSVDGLVYLDLFLDGKGGPAGELSGRGKLDVLEADIDRLPLLQDLFRIGNLQPPAGKAFEEVNCNFRVEGDRIAVERLELLGPANIIGPTFNLVNDGEGSLRLDTRELDMVLSARWGRGRFRIPVITPSFNLANDQVWSFHVRGRLDDPIVTPAPLRGFFRMFEGPRGASRRPAADASARPASFPRKSP